ncbi:MAG: hypothetical protein ACXVJJ_08780 [Halobacteriota archaeon]
MMNRSPGIGLPAVFLAPPLVFGVETIALGVVGKAVGRTPFLDWTVDRHDELRAIGVPRGSPISAVRSL